MSISIHHFPSPKNVSVILAFFICIGCILHNLLNDNPVLTDEAMLRIRRRAYDEAVERLTAHGTRLNKQGEQAAYAEAGNRLYLQFLQAEKKCPDLMTKELNNTNTGIDTSTL